jgi:hypothetical protein
MALTPERQKEMESELQQMQERLWAFADELEKEAISDKRYELVYKESRLTAKRVNNLLRMLRITPTLGGLDE